MTYQMSFRANGEVISRSKPTPSGLAISTKCTPRDHGIRHKALPVASLFHLFPLSPLTDHLVRARPSSRASCFGRRNKVRMASLVPSPRVFPFLLLQKSLIYYFSASRQARKKGETLVITESSQVPIRTLISTLGSSPHSL